VGGTPAHKDTASIPHARNKHKKAISETTPKIETHKITIFARFYSKKK
jgi:hypothetical protein